MNEEVVNWSHNFQKTRFHVTVGVAYGSDVDKVTKILLQCATQNEDVMDAPKPLVRFKDFGNSSLDFELHFWSRKIWDQEITTSNLRYAISRAFVENEIQIPFPQMDLHLRSGFNQSNKNE